jgi:plasmid stabilization system protein ParE
VRRTITPKDLIVTDPDYADLNEIFDFIAADNVDAAQRFGSENQPGLRLSVHGRYNIFFRVSGDETVILHIVHSARDIGRLSFDHDQSR